MQTKSVLTALSLTILCSTTAFGMGTLAAGTAVTCTVGACLFNKRFREIRETRERDRDWQKKLEQWAKEKRKRDQSITRELWKEHMKDQLGAGEVLRMERTISEKYDSDAHDNWTARDVPHPTPEEAKADKARILHARLYQARQEKSAVIKDEEVEI